MNFISIRVLLGTIFICLAQVGSAAANEVLVDESIQVPILFKVLTYDRTLMSEENQTLRIAVVYQEGHEASEENRRALSETLDEHRKKTIGGYTFDFVEFDYETAENLESSLEDLSIAVLYVAAGNDTNLVAIQQVTRKLGVLSLTGTTGYAERGVSIGLELEDERPRIHVNLDALREEGHDLKSKVLRLCTVYREAAR